MAVDVERLDKNLGGCVLHQPARIGRTGAVGEHQGERPPAEVAHAFGICIRLFEPGCYFLDQSVAYIAAQRVVDGAELAHVEHHDGAAGIGRIVAQALRKALAKKRPLGEPRQTVKL